MIRPWKIVLYFDSQLFGFCNFFNLNLHMLNKISTIILISFLFFALHIITFYVFCTFNTNIKISTQLMTHVMFPKPSLFLLELHCCTKTVRNTSVSHTILSWPDIINWHHKYTITPNMNPQLKIVPKQKQYYSLAGSHTQGKEVTKYWETEQGIVAFDSFMGFADNNNKNRII